jgi:hypothetical protein
MSTKTNDDSMSLEINGRVITTADISAADGHGAWIVSCHPGRLFTRNRVVTAMDLAERLQAGCGDDDPFVVGWREELGLLLIGSSRSRRRPRFRPWHM